MSTAIPQPGALSLLRQVILDPIREGRPRPSEWPPGMLPIGILALTSFGATMLAALFAAEIRENTVLTTSNPDLSLPVPAIPAFLWLLTLVFTLVQTATLHGHWLLRLSGLGLSAFGLTASKISSGVEGMVIALAGIVALAAFGWIRRRRAWAWWEFLVIAAIMTLCLLLPVGLRYEAYLFGLHRGLLLLSLMGGVSIAAMPTLMYAGYAPTDVIFRLGDWMDGALAISIRRSWRWITMGLLVIVASTVLSAVRYGWQPNLNLDETWAGMVAVAFAVVLALPIIGRASRVRRGVFLPSLEDQRFRWEPAAILMGIAWAAANANMPIAAILNAIGSSLEVEALTDASTFFSSLSSVWWYGNLWILAAGIAIWIIAERRAISGRIELGMAASFVVAVSVIDLAHEGRFINLPTTSAGVALAGLVFGVGFLIAGLIRRTHNLVPATLMILFSIAYDSRDLLTEPLTVLVSQAGLGAALFGLLWTALTVGDVIRSGSTALPQPTRVLLYFAAILLGGVMTAWLALSRQTGGMFDVDVMAGVGSWYLGVPLFGGALMVLGIAAMRTLTPLDRTPPRAVAPQGIPGHGQWPAPPTR